MGAGREDSLVMEQFTGSSQLASITVDRNTILKDWWVEEPDQPEEEDEMTPAERKAYAEVAALFGKAGSTRRRGWRCRRRCGGRSPSCWRRSRGAIYNLTKRTDIL